MRANYFSLAFLLTQELHVYSFVTDSGSFDSPRWSGSPLNPQSPSGSSSILCDRTKVKSGASDAHSTCHNECLALREVISTTCNAHPHNKIMKFLCNNCGTVTEGYCNTVVSVPLCWCHTRMGSKIQRRTPLVICRSGMLIMRKVINKETTTASAISTKSTEKRTKGQEMSGVAPMETVAMHQTPSSRPTARRRPRSGTNPSPRPPPAAGTGSGTRPGTVPEIRPVPGPVTFTFGTLPAVTYAGSSAGPSVLPPLSQQQEEDWNSRPDGQPEGSILWTDVRVSGDDVRAMVDTGSNVSMIHQKFAGKMVSSENKIAHSMSNEKLTIFGKTTINLAISRDISIPLTGFVTDRKHEILLGTDFFVAYKAKINIPDRTMEIFNGQTKVTMKIKFRGRPAASANMMSSDAARYTPLLISATLSGQNTRAMIDTGSSITIVDQGLVKQQILRPVTETCSFQGGSSVTFLGATDINLQFGYNSVTVSAYVPDFKPRRNLITGNDFNKNYVEVIDYESKLVTLRFPDSSGYKKVVTSAFVLKGQ